VGIFTSTDPLDYFWNTYSYVGGEPVNVTDPNGQAPDYNPALVNGGDNAYNDAVNQLYDLSQNTWQTMMDASEVVSLADLNSTIQGLQDFGSFMKYMTLMTKNDSWMRPALGYAIDTYGLVSNYLDPLSLHAKMVSSVYAEINYAIEERLCGSRYQGSRWSTHIGNVVSIGVGVGAFKYVTSTNTMDSRIDERVRFSNFL